MALIDWTPALAVGVAEIDDEHKKLVGLINALHEAMKQGRGQQVVASTVRELMEYVLIHFATEERLFARHGYPEATRHIAEHKALTAKVRDMEAALVQGKTLTMDVLTLLKAWITDHIQQTDFRYRKFFADKGVR